VKRLVFALLFVAFSGHAAVLQLPAYIDALESIRASVRAGDASAARTKAQQLLNADVDSPAGRITADSSLLHAVMASPQTSDARLTATINALRETTPPQPAPAVDARLVNHLRVEQSVPALGRGGEVDLAPAGDEKTLEKGTTWIGKTWSWVKRQWEKLANWFDRWWPTETLKEKKKTKGSARGIVIIVVAAIVLVIGVLAYEVIRRSRAAVPSPVVKSDLIASKRDDDPLSRGATEWERYASQLAAAGRVREAIRAWYHAVLVTLYGAGILHFRKGRTNWEYVAALSPEIAWRAQFVTLTRRFEEEWYGRDRSSSDALDEVADRAHHILDAVHRRAAA